MDPKANINEQYRIIASAEPDCERLAELILALDEWLASGGFAPSTPAELRCLRSDAVKLLQRKHMVDLLDPAGDEQDFDDHNFCDAAF